MGDEPALSITSEQFEPYLKKLRELQLDDIRYKGMTGLETHTQDHLKLFVDQDYSFPSMPVRGVEQINEQVSGVPPCATSMLMHVPPVKEDQ
jgi:hypothetical protein